MGRPIEFAVEEMLGLYGRWLLTDAGRAVCGLLSVQRVRIEAGDASLESGLRKRRDEGGEGGMAERAGRTMVETEIRSGTSSLREMSETSTSASRSRRAMLIYETGHCEQISIISAFAVRLAAREHYQVSLEGADLVHAPNAGR